MIPKIYVKLLEADGWEVDCHSPFEISHTEMESKATGYGAECVLSYTIDYVKKHKECPVTCKKFKLPKELPTY